MKKSRLIYNLISVYRIIMKTNKYFYDFADKVKRILGSIGAILYLVMMTPLFLIFAILKYGVGKIIFAWYDRLSDFQKRRYIRFSRKKFYPAEYATLKEYRN